MIYKKDKALKQKEKQMKSELRSYFKTSLWSSKARKGLEDKLKKGQYYKAKEYTKSQLNKITKQTQGTGSEGYYKKEQLRFKKRFSK